MIKRMMVLLTLVGMALGQAVNPPTKLQGKAHTKHEKHETKIKSGYGSSGYGLAAKINLKRLATTSVPSVSLTCTPGTGGGPPVGYNFLRSITNGGPYTLLGTSPMVSTCAYTDSTVALGTTYYYVANAMNGGGTSGFSNQISAAIPSPPTITSVSPSSGSTLGGTPVAITGTGFALGATVVFDTGIAATSVVVVSSTSITCVTPADTTAGAVSVTVTNSNGLSGSITNAYTYIQPPAAPTGLTAGTITASNVPLNWKAPIKQTNYTTVAYEIDRGTSPTLPGPTLIGIVPGTSFSDKKPCAKTCYYEVKAYDINNFMGTAFVISSPSNIVSVKE